LASVFTVHDFDLDVVTTLLLCFCVNSCCNVVCDVYAIITLTMEFLCAFSSCLCVNLLAFHVVI